MHGGRDTAATTIGRPCPRQERTRPLQPSQRDSVLTRLPWLPWGSARDDMAHYCRSYFFGSSIEDNDPNFSHMSTNVLGKDRTHRQKIKHECNWQRYTT